MSRFSTLWGRIRSHSVVVFSVPISNLLLSLWCVSNSHLVATWAISQIWPRLLFQTTFGMYVWVSLSFSLISFEPYFGLYFPTPYLTRISTYIFIIRNHWVGRIWSLFLAVLIIFLNWESPPQHFSYDIWLHQCTLYNLRLYW